MAGQFAGLFCRFHGKRKTESPENPEGSESGKKSPWSKFDDFPLDEKRKLYRCGKDYVTLKNIPTWSEYLQENSYAIYKRKGKTKEKPLFDVNETLNEKVSLWQGDITSLEVDAIVNAANNSLLGGGGVDGCIHRAAGSSLRQECTTLNGCETGDAKITSGHKLPAKYVIHTVGPIGKQEKQLRNCYSKCLHLVKKFGIRSVAFCCVSTGIYGYPIFDASSVALKTVRKWLEFKDEEGNKNADRVDRIIFCVFLGGDLEVYQHLLPRYFPSALKIEQQSDQEEDQDETRKEESGEEITEEPSDEGQPEEEETEDVEMAEKAIKEGDTDPRKHEESSDLQEKASKVEHQGGQEQGQNKNEEKEKLESGKDKNEEPNEEDTKDVEMVPEEIKEDDTDPRKLEALSDAQTKEAKVEQHSGQEQNQNQIGEKEEVGSGKDKNEEPSEDGQPKEEDTKDAEMVEKAIQEGVTDSQDSNARADQEKIVNKNVGSEGDQDSSKTNVEQVANNACTI